MSTPASDSASAETIVLIHGMWMTPLSWEHYASHYIDRGHRVIAPAWPGLDKEPAELRSDPAPLRGLSIKDIVDHYDKIIDSGATHLERFQGAGGNIDLRVTSGKRTDGRGLETELLRQFRCNRGG